jgi:hypothetical protein
VRSWVLLSYLTLTACTSPSAPTSAGAASTHRADLFECVLSAKRGFVRLDVGMQGCFGGNHHTVTLESSETSARILRKQGGEQGEPVEISPQELRDFTTELLAAVHREEVGTGCRSTARHFANVSWSCDDAATRTVSFSTDDCGKEDAALVARREGRALEREPHLRALAIYDIAKRVLTRRAWGSEPEETDPL